MAREELTTIAVLLLLFGVSWVAYASIQPFELVSPCGGGQLPSCNNPLAPTFFRIDSTAALFYTLGFAAIIFGAVVASVRVYLALKQRTPPMSAAQAK